MSKAWSVEGLPNLTGARAIVTGGNSGIGYAAARELLRAGAEVTLACRDLGKAELALKRMRDELGPESSGLAERARLARLDVADLASVRAFAEAYSGPLHLLVNNAGVMAIPYRKTIDGFEMQLGTNHLGHFALTGLLLPHLRAAEAQGERPPRVVNVSSQMHRAGRMRWHDLNWERGYNKWAAYAQSKLANLLFTHGLGVRLRAAGSSCLSLACHPGYAATHLARVGPELSGARVFAALTDIGGAIFAQSADAGAWPTLYAATAEVKSLDYIGPRAWFGLRGAPGHVSRTQAARDSEAADRLWEISERLTGVKYDFPEETC